MRLSKRLEGMEAYNPGGNPCPVVLNANESFIPASNGLMADFRAVLESCEFNRYPDPRAEELCKAFADLYNVDWNLVTAGNGSDESIDLLYACLVAPGDRVVTVNPDFSMYGHGAYMNDVEEIVYQKKGDYSIDVDKLLALAKERDSALILFSNPCNPTGVALPREEVIRLIDGFDGIVVVDEAYMDFGSDSVLDLAGKKENLVVLKTCSKALASAALRIGFTITTPEMTNLLQVGKAPYNVGRLVQALGTCVLKRKDEIRANIETINASTKELYEGLVKICEGSDLIDQVVPTSANFIYLPTNHAQDIFNKMQEHGVLIRAYGNESLRICSGNEDENAACLNAMEATLRELAQ